MNGSSIVPEVLGTAYLLLPLLGGALVHGLCLKFGWLGFLARPMDGGATLGGRPLFGRSKTFRGPLTVAAGAAAVFTLQQSLLHRVDSVASLELVDYAGLPGWWFGALVGGVAELAELPNSFVKRRLGIGPGATAGRPLLAVVFYFWDQLDVLLGFWLVFSIVVAVTPLRVATSVVLVGGIHPLLTLLAYGLGMRPTAR